MSDTSKPHPLRKPAILAVLGAFSIGMAFAPIAEHEGWAGIGGLVFLLYFVLGD